MSTATAYQVNGSSWTWHWYDNVTPGQFGMQVVFEDNYDMNNLCNHFWVAGSSWVDRPSSDGTPVDSVTLTDDWGFGTSVGSATSA